MENASADMNRKIVIHSQYIKDLSFENPAAPQSIAAQRNRPNVGISVNIEAKKIDETTFEVMLHLSAKTSVEDSVLFIAELQYAGLFTIENIEAEEIEKILFIYCPSILFPFARRILADITRDGGFLPLMIDPIDFATLYHQRHQKPVSETMN